MKKIEDKIFLGHANAVCSVKQNADGTGMTSCLPEEHEETLRAGLTQGEQ